MCIQSRHTITDRWSLGLPQRPSSALAATPTPRPPLACRHDMLADGIGFWNEDYCAAFLDSLATCMPDCDSLKKKKK